MANICIICLIFINFLWCCVSFNLKPSTLFLCKKTWTIYFFKWGGNLWICFSLSIARKYSVRNVIILRLGLHYATEKNFVAYSFWDRFTRGTTTIGLNVCFWSLQSFRSSLRIKCFLLAWKNVELQCTRELSIGIQVNI